MDTAARLESIELVFGQFLTIALGIIGSISVIMLVVAGFQYIGAGADKEGVSKAKGTLTFALIGLILAVSAFTILTIFGRFLGIANIGIFRVCFSTGCPT